MTDSYQDLSRCGASTKDLELARFDPKRCWIMFGPSQEDEKTSSEDFKKMKTCV